MGYCCWMRAQDPNHPACSAQLPTENSSKYDKHDLPPIPSDPSLSKLNTIDEVLRVYKFNYFCYSVLRAATQKFSDKNLIGQGGFGDVYKGWIYSYTKSAAEPNYRLAVAVKRLRKEGTQGNYEWMNELKILTKLNHPNIVKLLGYCCEGEHRMLVYEYLTKGSLEAYLLKEGDTELNWSRRIKIAIGAAKGLAYLHTAGRPVIHRDLKASNILLDDDFNAKLSDFGLAKFGPQDDKSHISTRVIGTRGYFAPEYIATGHLTLKTDVYSFGVVLLEIICSSGAVKKFIDVAAGNLAQWAKTYLSDKRELHHLIDKKLGRNLQIEEARRFAEIILQCLDSNPKSRPTMTEVVAALEQLEQNMESCIQQPLEQNTQSCIQDSYRFAKYPRMARVKSTKFVNFSLSTVAQSSKFNSHHVHYKRSPSK